MPPSLTAAATPLLLMRTLLRFDPQLPAGRLWCDPAIPGRYLPLRISGLALGNSHLTVEVTDDGAQFPGLEDLGVRLSPGPRPARGSQS